MIKCNFWLDSKNHGVDAPLSFASMHAIPRPGDEVVPGEDSGKWAAAYSGGSAVITFWRVTRLLWFLDGTVAIFVIPILEDKETKPNV